MRPSRWIALFGALLALVVARGSRATVIDGTSFTETPWIQLNGTLTGMGWAPDGSQRLFVIDKGGTVHIVRWGTPPTSMTFATISPIYTNSECGLIGLTFDPNFQVNHYVYFFVTVSASEQQIIRYTVVGDLATNKTVVISGLPTVGANHDGGSIGFGPDGKLYWGVGDNGNFAGTNADLTSLAAKIGRANADGSIPNDNPFFDGPDPNNDYIWARGFRNPFTLTFQPTTGALWMNVVGTSYEQVFVVRKGDHAGYSAYENNQPHGFLAPIIKYRTNGTDSATVIAAARAQNIVTFTAAATHGFRKGEKIDVAGVTDPSFDGTFFVATVPSMTTFTVVQNGPGGGSTGGTATTRHLGGCITGGTFYDGTQFGPAYRGNFFFGDYNSGRLMRAVLETDNTIASVDEWATNIANATDTSLGPDGALYYMSIGGTIYRTTFETSVQALVLSSTHLWMMEGGQTSVGVSLAIAPVANVTVNVARTSGDADVGVGAGASLTFTPTNWNVAQAVTITAADDLDTVPDAATLGVSSAGLASEGIFVNVIEDDANNFLVSRAHLSVEEGTSDTFLVALVKAPGAPLTATVARTAGDPDIDVAIGAALQFDAANFGVPQTVTIAAAEDTDTTDDIATISVTAPGIAGRLVAVTAKDNEVDAPLITSVPLTTAVLGVPYSYIVAATGRPAPTFSLVAGPPGMAIDASNGLLTWTPPALASYAVTVEAANGVRPDAQQSFAIAVAPDAAPTCMLTRPIQGELVSGKTAEFFGDGFDDVGTTKAEFFVDGLLGSTDENLTGHYHFGGEHNRWDTTALTNGAHKVKMVVSDTAGQKCQKEVDVNIVNVIDGGAPDASADGDAASDARNSDVADVGGDARDGADADPGDSDATFTVDAGRDAANEPDGAGSDGSGGSIAVDATGSDAGAGGSGGAGGSAGNDGGRDVNDAGQPTGDQASGSGCDCRMAARGDGARPPSALLLVFAATLGIARRRRHRTGAAPKSVC